MPELPEVETIKRELGKTVIGKKITGLIINNPFVIKEPPKEKFKKELTGAVIKKILRKGKALIFELSNGRYLLVHLRMTGQLVYPGTGKQARVVFKLSDGKSLDYNDRRILGELRLVDNWKEQRFFKTLGPEPFDLDAKTFKEMLSSKKTKIKPLLMDQAFISGVGNLYAAEALFRAKINPERSARSLTEKEKQALFREINDVLKEAIHYGGSSIDQYVQVSGKRGEYSKYHKVYGKENKPCPACKTLIKRTALGGRGTYFCPKCQR
jgi:formamidopyrimidine-DNA glycosylase